jgi:hypothetical protein
VKADHDEDVFGGRAAVINPADFEVEHFSIDLRQK